MSKNETKTFSVMDMLTGVSYPEDTVTIYTDARSAHEAHRLVLADADETDPDKSNDRSKRIEELKQKVRDSALTFHLQGFPPRIQQDIITEAESKFKVGTDEGDPTAAQEFAFNKSVALAVQKVVSADGSEDTGSWSVEDVEKFRGIVPPDQFNKLGEKVNEVIFAGIAFDLSVTPDF